MHDSLVIALTIYKLARRSSDHVFVATHLAAQRCFRETHSSETHDPLHLYKKTQNISISNVFVIWQLVR